MRIRIISTGGTIDKIYFDARSEFEVGSPQAGVLLAEANVSFDYEVLSLLRKDSLDLDDADRELIRATVAVDPCERIIITHGTDTMVQTARVLQSVENKVIVLTGSMQPAGQRVTDAIFNVGFAAAAVQLLPEGVYIAMNGRIHDPAITRKNVKANRFEKDIPR
ncbi:MAG: asparaginase [Pseudomonadales bacterium]|jgi:L-asparaginase|nr:asparaginase [Pseudomonadales bacterium]